MGKNYFYRQIVKLHLNSPLVTDYSQSFRRKIMWREIQRFADAIFPSKAGLAKTAGQKALENKQIFTGILKTFDGFSALVPTYGVYTILVCNEQRRGEATPTYFALEAGSE